MSDAQTEPVTAPAAEPVAGSASAAVSDQTTAAAQTDGPTEPNCQITDQTLAELRQLADRYPEPRSALLPMLHLIQSVEGRVSPRGIEVCADLLGLTAAQVAGVATFYTMYKRRPAGRHHIGVCTTALCAVMGGDEVLRTVQRQLGVEPEQTTADGLFSLERLECNAACDFAPVMMVDWEFMDDMTPAKATALLDDLAAGRPVQSSRGATITSWRQAERVLAGFSDGLADEGPSAGPSSLRGVELARQSGWTADSFQPDPAAPDDPPAPASTSQGASK